MKTFVYHWYSYLVWLLPRAISFNSFSPETFTTDPEKGKRCNEDKEYLPIAVLSRILAKSCVTPPYIFSAKGLRMIVLVSLIVLLRKLPVSTIFRVVHSYIAIYSVEWFLHLVIQHLDSGLEAQTHSCPSTITQWPQRNSWGLGTMLEISQDLISSCGRSSAPVVTMLSSRLIMIGCASLYVQAIEPSYRVYTIFLYKELQKGQYIFKFMHKVRKLEGGQYMTLELYQKSKHEHNT